MRSARNISPSGPSRQTHGWVLWIDGARTATATAASAVGASNRRSRGSLPVLVIVILLVEPYGGARHTEGKPDPWVLVRSALRGGSRPTECEGDPASRRRSDYSYDRSSAPRLLRRCVGRRSGRRWHPRCTTPSPGGCTSSRTGSTLRRSDPSAHGAGPHIPAVAGQLWLCDHERPGFTRRLWVRRAGPTQSASDARRPAGLARLGRSSRPTPRWPPSTR